MKRGVKKTKFDIKKTLPYKLLIINLAILGILIMALIIIKISPRTEEKELRGELAELGFGYEEETGIYLPQNCSDENFISAWDSVFRESSNSTIKISNKDANENCTDYVVYKILDNNMTYFMYGYIDDSSSSVRQDTYWIYGNLTEDARDYLKTINESNVAQIDDNLFIFNSIHGLNAAGERNILDTNEANQEFINIFFPENNTWFYSSFYKNYYFNSAEKEAAIYRDVTLDYFYYSKIVYKPINLTQIKDIENITLFNKRYWTLELDDYFANLGVGEQINISFNSSFPGSSQITYYYFHDLVLYPNSSIMGNFLANITIEYNGTYVNSNNFYINIIEPNYPKIPENCSDLSLVESWESVFRESSEGLTLLKNDSCGNISKSCPSYLLYKTKDTEIYILAGQLRNASYQLSEYSAGIYLNLSQDQINNFTSQYSGSIDCDNFDNDFSDSVENFLENLTDRPLIIDSKNSANNEFNKTFKINSVFTLEDDEAYIGEYYHGDSYLEYEIFFIIFGKESLNYFVFFNTSYEDVNFTKIKDIENITIYKNENLTNAIDLKDYVSYPGDSYVYVMRDYYYNVNPNITEKRFISFYPRPGWDGEVGLYVYFAAGKQVYSTNDFYVKVLNYTRPIVNNPPHFNSTACDDLEWEVNTDYKLNMRKCWYDPDGDSLTGFRSDNSSSNENLAISRDSTNLTLSPDTGWVGTGHFYIYASDGKNESSARVDFEVKNSSASGSTTGSSGSTGGSSSSTNTSANATNTTASNPRIILSSPRDNEVYIFPGNKTFSITAEKYSNIKWYLNGALVTGAENKLTYEFADLKEGDIVKVEVINGTRLDSKTWNIKIQEDIAGEVSVFDVGEVIFYLIIAIICIIILLIIWLFFVEKNKGIKTGSGFGISEPESNVKIIEGRDSNLDSLNIPG